MRLPALSKWIGSSMSYISFHWAGSRAGSSGATRGIDLVRNSGGEHPSLAYLRSVFNRIAVGTQDVLSSLRVG